MDNSFNEERYSSSSMLALGEIERNLRISTILELSAACGPKRILDIGCSDGFLSRLLKERTGAEIVGIEGSSTAAAQAREVCTRVHEIFLGSDPIPEEDRSFDLVVVGEVIEHVFQTEDMLEELRRVTRPGGHVLLTTPNLAAWFNRIMILMGHHPLFSDIGVRETNAGNPYIKAFTPPGHIRAFTMSSLSDILRRTGWKVVEKRGANVLNNKLRPMDLWISRRFPSLASDLIVLAQRV